MESYAASHCDFFFTICAHERSDSPVSSKPPAEAVIESPLWTKCR
jgi:hypothetical protein